jgi:hypothetical protein
VLEVARLRADGLSPGVRRDRPKVGATPVRFRCWAVGSRVAELGASLAVLGERVERESDGALEELEARGATGLNADRPDDVVVLGAVDRVDVRGTLYERGVDERPELERGV